MFRNIVVGFDGSEGSMRALDRAAELLAQSNARLHVVAVGRLPEYAETEGEVDSAKERAEVFYAKRLDEALGALAARGISTERQLVFGKPSEQIVRVAEAVSADLIILGTHPHNPIRRRLLGATADRVVDFAECSVLVVK